MGVTADVAGVSHQPRARVAYVLLAGPVPADRLHSASLLKPFLAWAACRPRAQSPTDGRGAAGAVEGVPGDLWSAVALSDNDATDRLVQGVGLEQTLGRVAELTGVRWEPGSTWGRVPVRARQVASAARELASAAAQGDRVAAAVIGAMHDVPAGQRLGVDALWAEAVGCPVAQVGVKLGWDLDQDGRTLRTHALVMDPDHTGVVLTAATLSASLAQRWRDLSASGGPQAVLGVHEEVAGTELRAAVRMAAGAATRTPGH